MICEREVVDVARHEGEAVVLEAGVPVPELLAIVAPGLAKVGPYPQPVPLGDPEERDRDDGNVEAQPATKESRTDGVCCPQKVAFLDLAQRLH